MKIKKFISLLASLAMMVTAVSGAMTASASDVANGTCGDGITWTLDSDGVLTLSGKGAMGETGDRFSTYTHWSYSEYADQIKEVVVEEGITRIGASAFGIGSSENSCVYPYLTKVTLPSTLEEVGESAFAFDNIEEINFPEKLKAMEIGAFKFTKLKSINLHEGMYIGGGAFVNCELLKEVTIPKNCTFGVTSAQGHDGPPATFDNCEGLEKVVFEKGVTDLSVESMFNHCAKLKNAYFYTTDLQSIVGSNTPYATEFSYTFPTYRNITFYVVKDSTTEQTLKDASYLTDENTVYIADTTALETAISEAEAIETDKYTDESVSALTKAIENAKAVLENLDATQEEVDSAVKAIEDAKTALTEKPDEPSSSDPSDSSNPSDNSSDPSNSSDNNNQSQSPNTPATPPTSAPTTATPKPTAPPTVTTTVAKPAKVKKVKLTAKKKKLNVSWKKVSGATGYEVMYATNNKFTKGKKTVKVKKNKVTIKKLKSKKKYFVKVRAYKTVNGNTSYGNWSKVVMKKTK